MTLTFSGAGRRTVQVGYLTEAPAVADLRTAWCWASSPLLQGWALVQNTGQDDWNGAP